MKVQLQVIGLTLALFSVPGMGLRFSDTATDLQLLKRVLAPFRFEDFSSFSDRPENYAKSDDPNDISFYLYNDAANPERFYNIQWNDDLSLLGLPWVAGAPVKILIHGFTQSQNSSMPQMVKNAYLEVMRRSTDDPSVNVNIICVDWGQLAGSTKATFVPIYSRAVKNVKTAGERVGELISNLIKLQITTYENVHIVGFSLGGHVAGWAGYTVQELNNGQKVKRITGLDPAGPFFTTGMLSFSTRDLNSGDAQLVDAIHTSWGSYGIPKKCGHSDFYPNFLQLTGIIGINILQTQPFCFNVLGAPLRPLQVCSHNMAPLYYAMSILKNITSCKCNSYTHYKFRCGQDCSTPATFGEYYEHETPGDYFLTLPKSLLFQPGPGEFSSSESKEDYDVSDNQFVSEENPSINDIRGHRRRLNQLKANSYDDARPLSACHNLSASTLETIRVAAKHHGLTYALPRGSFQPGVTCPSSSSSLVILYNSLDETYRLQRFSCQKGHLTPSLPPPEKLRHHTIQFFGLQSDDGQKSGLNCTVEYATKDKSSAFRIFTTNSANGKAKAGLEFRKHSKLNTVVGRGPHNSVHFMIH